MTVDEVNAVIPDLERIFVRIRELERELAARANELERLGLDARWQDAPPEPLASRLARLELARRELEAALDQIACLGGIVQDIDLGLVDFHHVLEGEEVFLCWRVGEVTVEHFHAVVAGLTARRRLPPPHLQNSKRNA